MKIRIYQINAQRDTDRIRFLGLRFLEKHQNKSKINSALYDVAYAGAVGAESLEGVFKAFNGYSDRPNGFTGRSLSVSDIVEVVESTRYKPGFYFCDSAGFCEVEFNPRLASNPVGRIDYLAPNGDPVESFVYCDAELFKNQIIQDSVCGIPMTIALFRQKDGSVIDQKFILDLDLPPKRMEIADWDDGLGKRIR